MNALEITPQSDEVTCLNAGHLPALVVDTRGNTRQFAGALDLPLGIQPDPIRCQRERLERGDLVALYTDGLSEMRASPDDLLGIERLGSELVSICNRTAVEPIARAAYHMEQLMRQATTAPLAQDDRTFLLARRR